MEDRVNHPKHYAGVPAMIECIDITRHLPFALGNAVKYLWRAGKKGGPEQEIEDLEKAQWYLDDWECWREHLPEVDFSAALGILHTISSDDMDPMRWDAIDFVLHEDMWNAKDTIDDWINEAKRRLSK